MTCVVDASVALKWFLADEPHGAEATALLRGDEAKIAPDLVIVEACNAAWTSLRLGRIEPSELADIAAILPRFFAELISTAPLAKRAAFIAVQLDHPIYDCFYLALAEARQAPLLTADTRLLQRVADSPWAANTVHLAHYRRSG